MTPRALYTLTWMAAFALIQLAAVCLAGWLDNAWLILIGLPACYIAITIINLAFQRWLGRWPP